MNQGIQQLQKNVEILQRSINKLQTKHINISKIKDESRSLVESYFKEFRLISLTGNESEETITKVDFLMQDLLRCTQRRALVTQYKGILKEIRLSINDLEIADIASNIKKAQSLGHDIKHYKIIDTLIKISPIATISFEQASNDLMDIERKSWRGTAVEFREALRELLDKMAPDESVKSQADFKLEKDAKGPTMKQKAVFIFKSRRASSRQKESFNAAIEIVDELVGSFVRSVYGRASVGTHTHVTKEEVLKIRDYVTLALSELLEIRT
jgi:hypothetical protein